MPCSRNKTVFDGVEGLFMELQAQEIVEKLGGRDKLRAEAKPMDCENCLYRQIEWREDSEQHCYMFAEKPENDLCRHMALFNIQPPEEPHVRESPS